MIKSIVNKEVIFSFVICICLIMISGIFIGANVFHYINYMDSDIASDTLLTEVLYQNNYRTPDTWYGSMERCVISAPNFAALLYPFLMDLNLSMGIACSALFIVLITVMFLYYRKMSYSIYAALIAALIPMILSRDAHNVLEMIILYAAYYVSHLIILYIMIILYSHVLRIGRVTIPVYLLTLSLAILGGLQGMHVIVFAFAPIAGAEVLRLLTEYIYDRKFYQKSITIWTMAVFVTSFLVTSLTGSDSSDKHRNIRHSIEKFTQIIFPQIRGVISIDGNNKFWVTALCIIGVIGYILLIRDTIKETKNDHDRLTDKWAMIPFIISFLIMIFSLTFTVTDSATRYYIMQMFIIGTGTGYVFRYIRNVVLEAGIVAIVTMVAILSIEADYNLYFDDNVIYNADKYRVVNWLEDNNYTDGYAVFDIANMLSVVSNNKVHIRSVDNMSNLNPCKWLTYAEWYKPYTMKDDHIVYIVVTDNDNEKFKAYLGQQEYNLIDYTEIGIYRLYVIDQDFVSF